MNHYFTEPFICRNNYMYTVSTICLENLRHYNLNSINKKILIRSCLVGTRLIVTLTQTLTYIYSHDVILITYKFIIQWTDYKITLQKRIILVLYRFFHCYKT